MRNAQHDGLKACGQGGRRVLQHPRRREPILSVKNQAAKRSLFDFTEWNSVVQYRFPPSREGRATDGEYYPGQQCAKAGIHKVNAQTCHRFLAGAPGPARELLR